MTTFQNNKKYGKVALLYICIFECLFAFGQTYRHDVTIHTNPGQFNMFPGEAMGEALSAQARAQAEVARAQAEAQARYQQLQQQQHLERLRNDPEYALKVRLNEKSFALSRVYNQNIQKLNALGEKDSNLAKEWDLLNGEGETSFKKSQPIFHRLKALEDKAKYLANNPKLLPQEKLEIESFLSSELISRTQMVRKINESFGNSWDHTRDNFNKVAEYFDNMDQKYFTEAQKYEHKIEYDNEAYKVYLNIFEKRVEILINFVREKEIFLSAVPIKEYKVIAQENKKFNKEVAKSKSFVKKYEKLFEQIEKRLGV